MLTTFDLQRCPDMIFAATPPYDGTLAGRYVLPADLYVSHAARGIRLGAMAITLTLDSLTSSRSCYKLPDNLSMEEGALVSFTQPSLLSSSSCSAPAVVN